jgi:hypothetical protein
MTGRMWPAGRTSPRPALVGRFNGGILSFYASFTLSRDSQIYTFQAIRTLFVSGFQLEVREISMGSTSFDYVLGLIEF